MCLELGRVKLLLLKLEWGRVDSFPDRYNCKLYGSTQSLTCTRKEGNVLFNDTLNTFHLQVYGVRHMVKDHSDSERENLLLPHGLLFYMHHPTDRITHTTAFVTPVVDHWLKQEIAQWVHPMKDQSDDPSHHERTLLPQSYISLPYMYKCTRDVIIIK